MRLINADLLIQELKIEFEIKKGTYLNRKDIRRYYDDLHEIIDKINEQPTAFDRNKVIEQLEDEAERSCADFGKYADEAGISEDDDWYFLGIKRAIQVIEDRKTD